jgi:hypothetical protein
MSEWRNAMPDQPSTQSISAEPYLHSLPQDSSCSAFLRTPIHLHTVFVKDSNRKRLVLAVI